MADPKIPSEGPMVPANTAKLMQAGVRQRYAISAAALGETKTKGGKK